MLQKANQDSVIVLSQTIEAKDPYTRGHCVRVRNYVKAIADELRLSRKNRIQLEFASILHDIGKMSVETCILRKPDTLTPEEWRIIHRHPEHGARMLQGIPFLEQAADSIRAHHERYDGEGYPNRLIGEAIPIGARLIAVADAFDAMTTNRAYRAALSVDYAVQELDRCSGSQFCPLAVKAFISGLHLRTAR